MSKVWTPRADQQLALDWVADRDVGALWLPVGSGKTAIAATWLHRLMFDSFRVRRAAIVAPPIVARQGWPYQLALWEHLAPMADHLRVVDFADLDLTKPAATAPVQFRDKRATKRHLQSLQERIHVMPWDVFVWASKAYGRNWPYDALVLDESSFLRDQDSERSKAVYHVARRLGAVRCQLQLAATPNANHDEAVWNQIDLMRPGHLGETLTQFRETFCLPDRVNRASGQVYSWKIAPSMRAAYEQRVAELAISLPESLGIEVLPVEHQLPFSGGVREVYDALARDWVALDGQVTCGSAAVLHLKLRQLSSGFLYDDKEQAHWFDQLKLDKVEELVETIGKPVLVAHAFIPEADALRARFGKHYRDIREPGAKAAFEAGKLQMLGVHPASAGHGVDGLQGASNHIIWTTVPEDAELWAQTNGRLKRPGQEADTVFAHVVVRNDTRENEVWNEVLPGKLTISELLLRSCRPVGLRV
jgi:hypothetical protein